MQVELRQLIKRLGITAIFVTHDQEEALTISDRIAVMRGGRIEQAAPPEEMFDRPGQRLRRRFHRVVELLGGARRRRPRGAARRAVRGDRSPGAGEGHGAAPQPAPQARRGRPVAAAQCSFTAPSARWSSTSRDRPTAKNCASSSCGRSGPARFPRARRSTLAVLDPDALPGLPGLMADAVLPAAPRRQTLGDTVLDKLISGRAIWSAVPAIVVLMVVAVIPFAILLSLGFSDIVVSRGAIVSQTFSLDHLRRRADRSALLDDIPALDEPRAQHDGALPALRLTRSPTCS